MSTCLFCGILGGIIVFAYFIGPGIYGPNEPIPGSVWILAAIIGGILGGLAGSGVKKK